MNDNEAKFGIFISRKSFTGSGIHDASSRRFKEYYDKRHVIVCITYEEFYDLIIKNNKSLVTILEDKWYEFVPKS